MKIILIIIFLIPFLGESQRKLTFPYRGGDSALTSDFFEYYAHHRIDSIQPCDSSLYDSASICFVEIEYSSSGNIIRPQLFGTVANSSDASIILGFFKS